MTVRRDKTPFGSAPRGRGFTAPELLIVISIIILILATAIPMMNVLSGSKSLDAAQNAVSAMLQRARSRAVALQERRGVYFFRDQQNQKMAMVIVKVVPGATPTVKAIEQDLDNADIEYMPAGVAAAISYLNTQQAGLILFDGYGRIEYLPAYVIGPVMKAAPDLVSKLGTLASAASTPTAVAVLLFDRQAFSSAGLTGSGLALTFSTAEQDWVEQNAVALVVNRYNGTLIRGE